MERHGHGPRLHAGVVIAVGLGGALGTVVRHETSLTFGAGGGRFPWAVFGVNVTGSFVLGLVATLVVERWPPTRYVRPFVGIGFCGGLTTFSTWMVDASLLTRDGAAATAAVYLASNLAVGLIAVYAGTVLARVRRDRAH